MFHDDDDGDGWGAAATVEACAQPVGFAPRAGDCDDTRGDLHPLALVDCERVVGAVTTPGDCDDADPSVGAERDWWVDADAAG